MTERYYLYISDAKVDMLLGQIDPAFLRPRTIETGLSLKLFSARQSTEAPPPGRTARLERVLRHLDETGQTGSVDEAGPYVHGVMPLQWGHLPGPAGGALVYFGGRTGRTILGLGGAGSHVLTSNPPQTQDFAPSSAPTLLAGLASAMAADNVEIAADQPSLAWVHTAGRMLRGPRQTMEFVARRLLAGPSPYPEIDGRPGMQVLLGSPLYVALAD